MKSAFSFDEYQLIPKDERTLKYDEIKWITDRIFTKTFRKAPVHPEAAADIQQKVKLSVEAGQPLYFILCFGGYKHFWNPSYPEVDFAELFELKFMSDYLAPILEAYEPGVVLEYESEDVIMSAMDNYPEKDLDRYSQSFRELIALFSKSIPSNFKIRLVRAREQVPEESLWKRINEYLPNTRKEWNSLSTAERDSRLGHSYSNMMWKGEKDLTSMSGKEREERVLESKILNETYYAADFDFRKYYLTGGNHIPLVCSFGTSRDNIGHWLTLGSTYSSMVDFWVGRGILEIKNGKVVERVVSHNQYDRIKDKLEVIEAFKDLPLKNLRNIEIGENLGIGESQKKEKDINAPQ